MNSFQSKNKIRKIAVVGNIAGGKTRLSRQLALWHQLPLTHVDSIQFLPDLKMRPFKESGIRLQETEKSDSWVIDGYGPLDLIENRFALADRVVFIDLPLWQHLWWLIKRQIKSLWSQRAELPPGSREFSFRHQKKMFKTLWSMHRQMRPELLKIFARPNLRDKVVVIKNKKEWRSIYFSGLC